MDYQSLSCEELEKILYSTDFDLLESSFFLDEEFNFDDKESKKYFEGLKKSYELTDNNQKNRIAEKEKFIQVFETLYRKSYNENYYWIFCSFSAYKNTFEKRYLNLKSKNFDDLELKDFAIIENDRINESFYRFEHGILSFDDKYDEKEFSIDLIDIEDEVLKLNYTKKIQFLKKIIVSDNNKLNTQNINLHAEIFCNNGFELFEYILNNHISENRGRKSDLNYYYRKLYNERYIIESCRAENFKQWYEINFNDDFGQIKTLDEVKTETRNRDYSSSLEWFKQHNR